MCVICSSLRSCSELRCWIPSNPRAQLGKLDQQLCSAMLWQRLESKGILVPCVWEVGKPVNRIWIARHVVCLSDFANIHV